MPTITDVAQRAGVAPITVSREVSTAADRVKGYQIAKLEAGLVGDKKTQ